MLPKITFGVLWKSRLLNLIAARVSPPDLKQISLSQRNSEPVLQAQSLPTAGFAPNGCGGREAGQWKQTCLDLFPSLSSVLSLWRALTLFSSDTKKYHLEEPGVYSKSQHF